MTSRAPIRKELKNGLVLIVKRDWYTHLWEVRYEDGWSKWAGPFRTKREAVTKLEEIEE